LHRKDIALEGRVAAVTAFAEVAIGDSCCVDGDGEKVCVRGCECLVGAPAPLDGSGGLAVVIGRNGHDGVTLFGSPAQQQRETVEAPGFALLEKGDNSAVSRLAPHVEPWNAVLDAQFVELTVDIVFGCGPDHKTGTVEQSVE
jgi:hypothetical protein